MKKKLIGILVVALMIATAFPAMGMSEDKESKVVNPDFWVHETNLVSEQMPPSIYPTFDRTWGTNREDWGQHAEIYDGHIYACGYCDYSNTHPDDIFLLKYDLGGNLVWNVTWGGSKAEGCYYLTGYNGHIYLCGHTKSYGEGKYDIVIIKFDTDGDVIWHETWGGPEDEFAYEIVAYENNLYISGSTKSYGSGNSDGCLLKFDTDGNFIWYGVYGGDGYDELGGITEYEGNIYVSGNRDDYSFLVLLKYDTDGNLIFDKQWREDTVQYGNAVIVYNENIYIAGGVGEGLYSNDKLYILLLKCDMNGDTKWYKTWAGGNYRSAGYDLEPYNECVYVVGRKWQATSYISDVALLKYNVNGDREWGKIWAASDEQSHEYGRSIQVYNDYLYISGGTGVKSGNSKFDALLLKCDLEGEPGNNNPVKPNKPSGPKIGKVGEETTYSTSTTDLDGEKVKFLFDWGEGNITWTDWVDAGTTASTSYVWTKGGDYQIRVKARDEKGGDSEWSDPLPIKMPKNKPSLSVVGMIDNEYERVDQSQTSSHYYSLIFGESLRAQSFKPAYDILTKVSLKLSKYGDPPDDCEFIVTIKRSLTGDTLATVSIIPTTEEGWVDFDFPDISVTPEETYYIIGNCKGDLGEDGCWRWWANGGGTIDYYKRGKGWYSSDGGNIWDVMEEYDMTFKTWAPDETPDTPSITGPTKGKSGEQQSYIISTTDPENDEIYYYIEWGDEQIEEWIGPSQSGEEVTVQHTWTDKDTYTIKVKAKDVWGAESDWATLEINMPKNKAINTPFLRFLENHPHMFPLLRQLLKL